MKTNVSGISRRAMLKTVAVTGLAASLAPAALGQAAATGDGRARLVAYLESLRRPDGGYAYDDLVESHLTPTFAVIGCYQVLGQDPPDKRKLVEFVRTHHPAQLRKQEQEHHDFEVQQIQSLLWLGEDVSSFQAQVRGWKVPYQYLPQYEKNRCPIFRSEMASFTCRKLLGLPLSDLSPAYLDYFNARRRANGSFNNTPAEDGSDGNILNTLWGLQALAALGRLEEKKKETIEWLQACQLPGGGFTHQPKPEFAGVDDAAYTWAAVKALKLLGATPLNAGGCVQYLHSLANEDFGFGDRSGWAANPVATFYALEALQVQNAAGSPPARKSPIANRKSVPPAELKAFTIQIESHGTGSPTEAVDLARSLRIHLWGAKNAKPGWLAKAQALADEQKVPVTFFTADEEYGTWVSVAGMGTYSHTSDMIAPPRGDIGPSMANKGVVTWSQFREQRLVPLQKGGGHLIWQFGPNEELTRLYLDDSIQRGGYAAISTFHFGNPDFTNTEPFLNRYRGQIPYVGLQDAHGGEPWWFSDMTTGFRTVFLATEPTWAGWQNALKNNWVLAVRHDAVSSYKTWLHGGAKEVIDAIRKRENDWRWWDNPQIQRPMVSLVALKPEDEFEAGRPEKGVLLRVRCARENTTQGVPKRPLAELVKLVVDGKEVATTLLERKGGQGKQAQAITDYQHQYHMPSPGAGKHTATVTVRVVDTKAEVSRSIEFVG
jgi:hypothetical protein